MVEFLFGHSGSGKTTRIYNNIRQDLSEKKRVMLVVPDQEAVSAEAMCADVTQGVPSYELYVCSFSRLCNDVFRKYGGIVYNYADYVPSENISKSIIRYRFPIRLHCLSYIRQSANLNDAV